MMISHWIEWSILQGLCLFFMCSEVYTECTFPEYLQSPMNENNEPMPWLTKVWWLNLRNEPKQKEMQEVFVMRDHIWSQKQNNRWPCEYVSTRTSRRLRHRATQFGNCSEKYLEYNRTCVMEEKFNRFRVIQYGPGMTATFVCLKFVKRSENVVQTMEGPTRTDNSADLCDDNKMVLQDWPWIAPWRKEVTTCPISGGFSFRTVSRLTNQPENTWFGESVTDLLLSFPDIYTTKKETVFCPNEWRKSRLEIDCAKGDGLNFIAPKGSDKCNPFSTHFEVSRFYCWAGWQVKYFTYLVIGEENGIPQYCLRFPRDPEKEFTVTVYFSVVCPTDPDGRPERGIEYLEMKMTKLNSENCTDDDDFRCQQVVRRGQCAKEEKYATHCERSCGRCARRQNQVEMMCQFSPSAYGPWLFNDIFHEETVHINETTAVFPKFGTFTCKEKSLSPKLNFYKTVTTFTNGCAMRYTCFEFHRRNQNILQFRVGGSFRTDIGFDEMCHFDDPQNPVEDVYRGSQMKNLILDGNHWDQYCGFGHTIPFNGSIYGEHCSGHLSDWDADGCVATGTLYVRSDKCHSRDMPMEFQCLGFLKEKDNILEQFLITKSRKTGEYNCWVITSSVCESWDWKFRAMYRLQSPQCTTLSKSACIIDNSPRAFLYLHDEKKSKYCKPEHLPDMTFPGLATTLPRPINDNGGVTYSTYWTPDAKGISGAAAASIHQHSSAVLTMITALTTVFTWLAT